LRCNLSKNITQIRLYCSKQLETTFHSFCEKPLHIDSLLKGVCLDTKNGQFTDFYLSLAPMTSVKYVMAQTMSQTVNDGPLNMLSGGGLQTLHLADDDAVDSLDR